MPSGRYVSAILERVVTSNLWSNWSSALTLWENQPRAPDHRLVADIRDL